MLIIFVPAEPGLRAQALDAAATARTAARAEPEPEAGGELALQLALLKPGETDVQLAVKQEPVDGYVGWAEHFMAGT